MFKRMLCLLGLWCLSSAVPATAQPQSLRPMLARLRELKPLLGHRNWIVIADSAYPLQIAPGIETIHADADLLEVAAAVLSELGSAPHVRPSIMIDAELEHVPERHAPGIEAYYAALRQLLAGREARALPHERIIAQLDEAGKTFKVLIIKTRMALPYTSIFLELDCGYWSNDAERELRAAMETGQ